MKVLCVAEKPSIAKSITEILSGGRWDTVSLPFLLPSPAVAIGRIDELALTNRAGCADDIARLGPQVCPQLRL